VLKNGGVYGHHEGQLVRLAMRQAGQYSERPYWELTPKADAASNPATGTPTPEGAPEAPSGADSDRSLPPRLRLVVPGR